LDQEDRAETSDAYPHFAYYSPERNPHQAQRVARKTSPTPPLAAFAPHAPTNSLHNGSRHSQEVHVYGPQEVSQPLNNRSKHDIKHIASSLSHLSTHSPVRLPSYNPQLTSPSRPEAKYQRGTRVIKPKKTSLITQNKIKHKAVAGLVGHTEKMLAQKAGHLEILKGGKRDKKPEAGKGKDGNK
jgi:hypothetical protein